MRVKDYRYKIADTSYEDRKGVASLDRAEYMTPQYIDDTYDWLKEIKLTGKTAVLYAGGAVLHSAENREADTSFNCSVKVNEAGPVIKSLSAYMLHQYVGILSNGNNITYANINGNTCASSMYSVYEAEGLLARGVVDNVIIIAEEKTSSDTIRIFKEHGIDLLPGEGYAILVLTNEVGGTQVTNTKWEYSYNRNPFFVSIEGYSKLATECDRVKGHKTGTSQNDTAEQAVFGDTIGYKDTIGHCQGASGLIEVCMVLDDTSLDGSTLCVASGLGGFYGSCLVCK